MEPKETYPSGQAMEGRNTDDTGNETDAGFHEIAWNTSPEASRKDLEAMAEHVDDLAESQLERVAAIDPQAAIKGYEHLVASEQAGENVTRWIKRIAELKDRNNG